MDFKEYFLLHAKKHDAIMPQDVAKFCYQAALGAEHLLVDIEAAKRYFDAEFDQVDARQGDLVEFLTDELCRVDLGVWKSRGLSGRALFDVFVGAAAKIGGKDILSSYLDDAESCFGELELGFSLEDWHEFLEKYTEAGMPAVHHSNAYRESERPSYRVVRRSVLEKII